LILVAGNSLNQSAPAAKERHAGDPAEVDVTGDQKGLVKEESRTYLLIPRSQPIQPVFGSRSASMNRSIQLGPVGLVKL
jgi:hypothetical protein